VRGSIAVPSADTVRYGGNTSCMEVQVPGAESCMFDAGTGARPFGRALLGRPERAVHMFISHFHLDHLFGFPFFAPAFAPSFRLSLAAPGFAAEATRERMGRYVNGVLHPLRMPDLPAPIDFAAVRPGRVVEQGPYRVTPTQLNHPGGACGYVIEGGGRKVAYLTDTSPLSRPGEGLSGGGAPNGREAALIKLLRGADLVTMDTMFTEQEYLEKMTWGHGYPEYAVALCRAAEVRTLALFHHSPDATDADLDRLADHWSERRGGLRVIVAREGADVDLEG
jgi:phosphoribosyl 1,2-cyclic phosphodiesterase